MRRELAVAVVLAALAAAEPIPVNTAVAILAFSATETNEVTALESNLEMLGVPFETTADIVHALRARVVVLAGTLTNNSLSSPDRERLYRFVESGGVLFATHVQGNQFFPLFGLAGFRANRGNFRLQFVDSSQDASLSYSNRPEEQEIHLGDPKRYREVNWTTEYRLAGAKALGYFHEEAVAFARNYYGRGIAYCLGLSFADSTLRWALGQSFEAEHQWANVFAPSADVLRLILRALYESVVHPFVLIHPIPNGQQTALLLSHDIDARESFQNSAAFAALERQYGVTSTFFVTTKYFTDAADTGYYTVQNIAHLRELYKLGFDLGSHTVSHLKTFHRCPMGDPTVAFDSYRPGQAPTVYGEVRVSKQLLEHDIPGRQLISFRAGELSHPPELIRALEAAGYQVDSTRAAGATLTNYAYRPLREAHVGAPVSDLIEVPVTLDDSMGYLHSAADLNRVAAQWIDIIAANAENNALTCLLIHPTDTTFKLKAEERVLQAYHDKPVWIGDVTRFGLFARARSSVRVTAFTCGGQLLLRLNRARAAVPAGLTLVVESDPRSANVIVRDIQDEVIPFEEVIRENRNFLILHP